mmetsp:Transcript_35308/g.88064  ORF Transcript_35308/g.88064 Transcript_35308/m.88064 type:complete len:475 (-) Transcript_35308:172-1596(-)
MQALGTIVGEGMQEANLYEALREHPLRTYKASKAKLFYLPIWEYTSFRLGECNGTDHTRRMLALNKSIRRSFYFIRSSGRDHFWASSMATEVTNNPIQRSSRVYKYIDKRKAVPGHKLVTASLMQRIWPNGPFLFNTTVGRHKQFQPFLMTSRSQMVVGRCTIDMGHQPNQVALSAYAPAARLTKENNTALPARPIFLSFAGGLDVCCTGRHIRCQVGQLLLDDSPVISIDIGVRGDALRHLGDAAKTVPCTIKALQALADKRKKPLSAMVAELVAKGGQDDVHSNKYQQMGLTMAKSVFCLCPAGDLCAASRTMSAIAAGCIPVILCDLLTGPYSVRMGPRLRRVPYEDFWISFPVAKFLRRPASLLEMLRCITPEEILRRQVLMALHRPSVLLQLPGWQAATRFLEAVADCVELVMHSTVLPKEYLVPERTVGPGASRAHTLVLAAASPRRGPALAHNTSARRRAKVAGAPI